MSNLLKKAGSRLVSKVETKMTLDEYLTKAKKDPLMYATAPERLLAAIGDPKLVDTRKDERLGRIFSNETISVYDAFSEIYGLENPLREIVSFIKHAAQGLEERKQILYLLGPVGSSKSSIVRLIKKLMESVPFYTLALDYDELNKEDKIVIENGKTVARKPFEDKTGLEISPVLDNPLSLFSKEDAKELGIPDRYLGVTVSPWLTKRIEELDGDISKFTVLKIYPSETHQRAISHIEPGDENNQDISSLVGKLNIRETLEKNVHDPDAYSFSGGLCLGNRGIVEFAEMFKSPIKSLNPLLEATQSGFYKGTESIAAIPFEGIIIAHSNESEWQKFRTDKRNEALIDRIFIVRIPYCLRYSEEVKIYQKMLKESSLSENPCAPKTLETLAQFGVLSRLVPFSGSKLETKMDVYNGENLKAKNIEAKSVYEYQKSAHESGLDEGFFGISTRFNFKAIARTFNYDSSEVAANPLHLLFILQDMVKNEHLGQEEEKKLLAIISYLTKDFTKFLQKEIQKAFLDGGEEYGQTIFDRYVVYADNWLNEDDYRDPNSNLLMTSQDLEKFLEEVETPANVTNKRDFRNEIVKFCFKYQAQHEGSNPKWTSYQKIREVIEAKIFSNMEDMLPIISSHSKASPEDKKTHDKFVERMMDSGYTRKQVNVLVDYYVKASKE